MEQSKQRKFVVLGFSAVGKSAITNQFVHEHFPDYYNPTIEATFQKTVKYKGKDIEIYIRDTSGQDEYTILPHRYCVGVHGYILLYSVDSLQSFEMVKIIHEKLINLIGTDKVPRILVGNKNDLDYERKISSEEGRAMAESWGCPFVECSAKLNQNVTKVFSLLLSEIDKENKDDSQRDSSCLSLLFGRCKTVSLSTKIRKRFRHVLLGLAVWTLLLGLASTGVGSLLGVEAYSQGGSSWLAYGLLGSGLFTLLMSSVGVYGILFNNKEFINVYSFSLMLALLAQLLLVCMVMTAECSTGCEWVHHQTALVVCVSLFIWFTELLALTVSCVLRANSQQESPEYQLIP